MKKSVPITVKRECETRWSARFEVVKCVNEGIVELVDLLERLADDRDSSRTCGARQKIFSLVF